MTYHHEEYTHNLKSPEIIVPYLVKLLQPKNVVDIGCGVGTFLYSFKKMGVKEVLGLDGEWASKELLSKYLNDNEFKATNLSEVVAFEKKFDLAVCLEVAEHIAEEYADNFIKTLVNASDVIVFSAALPHQGGQRHLNEQWPHYWQSKFSKYDYHFHDVLRPLFWNNPSVDFWYKQNMFLVTHKNKLINNTTPAELNKAAFSNLVHPDAFEKRSKELDAIVSGRRSTLFYLKLLAKNFLNVAKGKKVES